MPNSTPYVPEIQIDKSLSTPLHIQIAEPLIQLIESGSLPPGTKLEDEVSMAERLGVSRPTARRALETLTNRGLIQRRRGAGTQVTPTQVRRAMSLTSLNDDLIGSGGVPRTSVLEWAAEAATPGVAEALGLADGASVVHIRRLRLLDGEPLAIMSNWLPPDVAPSQEALSTRGLYELLREADVRIAVGVQQIGARLATAEEARLLNEPTGSALLTMQRTAFDESNRAIEFGRHAYRASMYSYDQTVFA